MKKAFLIIIISMVVYLFSFFINKCFAWIDPNSCELSPNAECCCDPMYQFQSYCSSYASSCEGGNTAGDGGNTPGEGTNTGPQCAPERVYSMGNGLTGCCPSDLTDDGVCNALLEDVGITINTQCLTNGQCGLNVYKVLGIRQSSGGRPSVSLFFEDIVLAATSFVGTVITIALIISGLIFAFGSLTGKDTKKAKTIMIDCFIGLLLVMGSYTIIRLIQFVAKAGGGS